LINYLKFLITKYRIHHLIRYFFSKNKFDYHFIESNVDFKITSLLIKKYKNKILENKNKNSKLWDQILNKKYHDLYSAIEINDVKCTSIILSKFFRDKCIRGAEDGDLFKNPILNVSHKQLILEGILALAHYDGILDYPAPYQVNNYKHSQTNYVKLYNKISKKFPLKTIPNYGSPYGLNVGNGVINHRFIESLFLNLELKNILTNFNFSTKNKLNFLEIGGGSGLNALNLFFFFKGNIKKIYLVDLPQMLIFQEYLIRSTLKKSELRYFEFISNSDFEKANIKYDVMINKDSIPEINKKESLKYIQNFSKSKNSLFFSLNHESRSFKQNPVKELISKFKNISVVSRDYSKIKEGYIKEIYISN